MNATMFRNVLRRSSLLLFNDCLSTRVKVPSVYFVFQRNTTNKPQSAVADDAQSQTSHHQQPGMVKVLYDGECNLCTHEIRVLRSLASKQPIDFIDINQPNFKAEDFSGVTFEMAMKEMHVIGRDGKVYVQGDAVREMYRSCGLGWLSAATELPGIREICDKMYMKFAHYRLEKALDRCDAGDSCSVKLKHLRDKLRPQ